MSQDQAIAKATNREPHRSATSESSSLAIVIFVSLVVSVPLFLRLTSPSVHTDIMDHARLAQGIIENGDWISYSLWYPVIFIASGGAESHALMRIASIVLLSILVTLKSVVVFAVARKFLGSARYAAVISICMLFVMPLIDPAHPKDIYLGQISATIWHNSTNILALPFAIAAFFAALNMLRRTTLKSAAVFGGLALVSVLSKPNFALAFLPIIGIAVLVVLWKQRQTWGHWISVISIAFVPSTVILALQFVTVYGSHSITETKVGLAPFVVWNAFSSNIPLSLAVSFAGPIMVLLAIPSNRRRSAHMIIGWATTVFAVVQLSLLGELLPNGETALSGNWFWGSYTAMAILFLVSFIELSRVIVANPPTAGRIIVTTVAAITMLGHVGSGIYYVLNIGVGDFPSY